MYVDYFVNPLLNFNIGYNYSISLCFFTELLHFLSLSLTLFLLFSSPENKVLRVSFCDCPLSVVRQCVSAFSLFHSNDFFSKSTHWPNFTEMIPEWSLTKVVQTVPVGCLSRSQGKNDTLNYIQQTLNDFCSWSAKVNSTKLNRIRPWVVSYQNCSNGSDWLHK